MKDSNTLISVITINYNNKEGLQKTIQSTIEQTYKDFEYIIIDGGSTDGSKEVIESNSKYISYWVSEPDNGIYHAMNKGVAQAKGEYCIFMNSGDRFANKRVLEDVSSLIISKEYDYYSGITLFSNKDNILKKKNIPPKSITLKNTFTSSLQHQSTFMRRSILMNLPYNEEYKIISDGLHFMQSIVFNNATYQPLNINIAIFDTNGVSRTNLQKLEKEYDEILHKYIPPKILEDYLVFCNPKETIIISKKQHPTLFNIFLKIKSVLRCIKNML